MLSPYFLQGRTNTNKLPKPGRYGYCLDCGHAVKLHVRPHLEPTNFPLGTCIQCEDVNGKRPICSFVVELFKDAKDLKEVKDIGKQHKKDQLKK